MITKYSNFKSERFSSREPLPAGGYVAKITDAVQQSYSWGDVLVVSFDICEGEYKNFFANDYRNNINDNKKWRGTYRINIPSEKSRYPESDEKTFNNFVACLEETNSGYHWDWDETKLKNKGIGVIFRNKEWEMEDKTGWTTECCAVTTANEIREGKFKTPKDKPLKEKTASAPSAAPVDFDDDDVPF